MSIQNRKTNRGDPLSPHRPIGYDENRHLNSLLESRMEEERRYAYATRLQCWWRSMLAVKVKFRKVHALTETPLEVVEEEAEKAALILQV